MNKIELNIKPLMDAMADWVEVTDKVDYLPVSYTIDMVNYQKSYISHFSDQYVDLSVVLYDDNNMPVGIWPLHVKKNHDGWKCGSNDGHVMPPLFVSAVSERIAKKLITKCIQVLDKICLLTNQETWTGVESIRNSSLGLWYRKVREIGAHINVSHELYVDLSKSLESIRVNIRKSYKALISKGLKTWDISIHDCVDDDVFDEFRLFHQTVAGRVTRPIETWELQKTAMNNKSAFLVVLRDTDHRMVGAGLFQTSKHEGVYAVGVYDRNLFDQPLGHVVQMVAIEHLKSLNVRLYLIGYKPYMIDGSSPTEKEISIAHFKEGFSTDMFLRISYTLNKT